MSQLIKEYLKHKDIRNNMTYRIKANGDHGYLLANVCLMGDKEVHEMYPLYDGKLTLWNTNYKGENPDGTRVK